MDSSALLIFLAVWFGIPILVLLIYLMTRCRVVEQGTAMVVERCGKFHGRYDAGCHCLLPCADRPREITWRLSETYLTGTTQGVRIQQTRTDRIDLRENAMDFPNQPIITRDNVEIQVHPLLFYKLIDPVRVAYETYDLPHAVEKLVQTALRSIIGDMGLDDTLASREEIERSLRIKIKNICHNWGLEIKSVELLEITPTSTVQQAMHEQLTAERIRRADIVTADGLRQQMKTEAEGKSTQQINIATGRRDEMVLRAKGLSESRKLIARAEADAFVRVANALRGAWFKQEMATAKASGFETLAAMLKEVADHYDATIASKPESRIAGNVKQWVEEAVQRYALTGREGASANGLTDRLQECEAKSAQYMIATKYIDAFTEITNNASYRTVFFPVETDVAGAAGRVA